MKEVVIVDCIRTPMGRSKAGVFRNVRAETLSAHLMQQLLVRNPNLDPALIEYIIWGNVKQTKEQGFNIARGVVIRSDLPETGSRSHPGRGSYGRGRAKWQPSWAPTTPGQPGRGGKFPSRPGGRDGNFPARPGVRDVNFTPRTDLNLGECFFWEVGASRANGPPHQTKKNSVPRGLPDQPKKTWNHEPPDKTNKKQGIMSHRTEEMKFTARAT